MPTNYTPSTARAIAALPATITVDPNPSPTDTGYPQSCNSGSQLYPLWFKYTALACDVTLAINAVASVGATYFPMTDLWIGTPPSLTEYNPNPVGIGPFCNNFPATPGSPSWSNVPVVPGVTYYIQVIQQSGAGAPVGETLSLTVESAPSGAIGSGAILVPADLRPMPATAVGVVSGAIVRQFALPATEQSAFASDGTYATWVLTNAGAPATLNIYKPDLVTLLASITTVIAPAHPDGDASIVARGTHFYIVSRNNVSGAAMLYQINHAGTILNSWTDATFTAIAGISPDEHYAYWISSSGVSKYDLLASTSVGTIVAGPLSTGARDLLVTASGDLIAVSAVSGTNYTLTRWSNVGTSLETYGPFSSTTTPPRMNMFTDDPTSFVLMQVNQPAVFSRIATAGGAVISTVTVPNNPASGIGFAQPFGPATTCPVLITPAPFAACSNPPPGSNTCAVCGNEDGDCDDCD